MLAFRVMEVLRRGRGASLLAICGAFVAFQCGQDEFDLLPAGQADGPPGASDGGEFSGDPPDGTGGRTDPPNSPCAPGGPCDECDNDAHCFFPGLPFCVEHRCVTCKVFPNGDHTCGSGRKCDRSICRPRCPELECERSYFCDVEFDRFTCVECKEDSDCEGRENGNQCFDGSCVECLNSSACTGGAICTSYGTCYKEQ